MRKKNPRQRPNQKIKARRSKGRTRSAPVISEKAQKLLDKFWLGI